MRYFRIISALILLLFVAFQYNDPDPEVWMSIYGIGALLCLLNFKNPAIWIVIVSLIFVLVSLGFSIYNWPETWMGFDQTNPPNLNVEKARESCGLLIGSLLVGISLIKIKPKI